MKYYNAMSKRLPDGNLEYTVGYKLNSENELFLLNNDLDTVMMYEEDTEYIVHLGLFMEKLPSKYADEKIRVEGDAFWKGIERKIINFILTDYYNDDENFKMFVKNNNYDVAAIKDEIEKAEDYVIAFCDLYYGLIDYFDNWAVVKTDDKFSEIKKILLRPKEDEHLETIKWE